MEEILGVGNWVRFAKKGPICRGFSTVVEKAGGARPNPTSNVGLNGVWARWPGLWLILGFDSLFMVVVRFFIC